METIKLNSLADLPKGFTGIVDYGNKDKIWFKDGKRHRENGPAIEFADGEKHWYFNDKLHRIDGPAIVYKDGRKSCYIEGINYSKIAFNRRIQEMNAAKEQVLKIKNEREIPENYTGKVEFSEGIGIKISYKDGKYHCLDGPAWENHHGVKEWFVNGERHREDGPAVVFPSGHKEWYINGKHHREDGPAIEYSDGTKEWWLNDVAHTEKEFTLKVTRLNAAQKNKLQKKEETKVENIIQTLKNDSKHVAKRTAARKIVKIASSLLAGMIGSGKTKRQINSIKSTMEQFLSTKDGEALLGIILGSCLPLILSQLPKKYHEIANEMAQEFRVEGMSHFTTVLADFLTGPLFQMAKVSLTGALDNVLENKDQFRIELGTETETENDSHSSVSENEKNPGNEKFRATA